jgi:hypothetical protein
MRDFAPHRRFLDQGLVLFDLRNTRPSAVLRMVIKFGRLKYHLACNDRVYKFIRNFVSSLTVKTGFKSPGRPLAVEY